MRTGPGTGYSIAGQAASGQLYAVAQSLTGWYKIWWRGGGYYVSSGYVVKVAM